MENFWSTAAKTCGASAISGILIYTVYPLILNPQILAHLNPNYRIAITILIAILTFVISFKIIPPTNKQSKKTNGNKISIKNSSINGGVVGGDKHEHKQ